MRRHLDHLDWPGALLVTLGLGGITYALIEWPNRHSDHAGAVVTVAAIAGALALAGFVVVEMRSRAPMVSFALFRSCNFTGANVLTLLLYAAMSGLWFFLPMDLIQVQHYTATEAGAAFLPFILIMFGLSRWAGGLVARFGSRPPLIVGPLVAGCGIADFALAPQTGSYWVAVFPAVALMGLGMTIGVAPLTTTVMSAVPESESGLASGINNAVSRLAGLLAVALFGVVLVAVFNRSLDGMLVPLAVNTATRAQIDAGKPLLAAAHYPDPAIERAVTGSFLSGYHAVLWLATALAALSAVAAWLMIGRGESANSRSRDQTV